MIAWLPLISLSKLFYQMLLASVMYKVLPKYFTQMFVKSFANSIFKQLFELKYIKNICGGAW